MRHNEHEDQMGAHANFAGHYGGQTEAVMALKLVLVLSAIFWIVVPVLWLSTFVKIMISLVFSCSVAFAVKKLIAHLQRHNGIPQMHPSLNARAYRTTRTDAEVEKALEHARDKGRLRQWERDDK